jgi:aspartokinase
MSALKRTTDLFVACYAKELDQQKTEVEKFRRDTTALRNVAESQRRELQNDLSTLHVASAVT